MGHLAILVDKNSEFFIKVVRCVVAMLRDPQLPVRFQACVALRCVCAWCVCVAVAVSMIVFVSVSVLRCMCVAVTCVAALVCLCTYKCTCV